MDTQKLIPDFVHGEHVVVINKEGEELARGPLLSIQKGVYCCIDFKVGSEIFSLYPGRSNKRYILNAEQFDHQLRQQILAEMSDVADKFISYARGSMTDSEMDRAEALIAELTHLGKAASERKFESRERKGASPKSFQGMWGNSALEPEKIKAEKLERLGFAFSMSYEQILKEIDSLEQSDRVVEFATGKPITQKALKPARQEQG